MQVQKPKGEGGTGVDSGPCRSFGFLSLQYDGELAFPILVVFRALFLMDTQRNSFWKGVHSDNQIDSSLSQSSREVMDISPIMIILRALESCKYSEDIFGVSRLLEETSVGYLRRTVKPTADPRAIGNKIEVAGWAKTADGRVK